MQPRMEPKEPIVKVDASMDEHTIVLVPLEESGQALLAQALVDPEKHAWHFHGSRYKSPYVKDRLIGTHYTLGGEETRVTEGNVTSMKHLGGTEIYFDLTAVADDAALYAMRNYGYFTGGLQVQEGSTPDRVLLCSPKRCKVCDGPLKGLIELEWRVCNNCSAVCQHEYTWGVGQADGHVAYLPFCETCGRGDPDWQPSENPMEDIAKTVSEGGLDMLVLKHEDGTSTVLSKKE